MVVENAESSKFPHFHLFSFFTNSDADCNPYLLPNSTVPVGATCNLNTCMCECQAGYCLEGAVTCSAENYNAGTGRCDVGNNDATEDISCQYKCACLQACNVGGTATTAEGNCNKVPDPNSNAEYDDCPTCSTDSECSTDEDCVKQDQSTSFCVGSGLCTDAKSSMCDSAYEAVTGSPNNRAKCCPDTSGCIKTRIGVIHTSTCGNTCGTSCLGDEKNPGNYGHSPSTFCSFGSRLGMCQFLLNSCLNAFRYCSHPHLELSCLLISFFCPFDHSPHSCRKYAVLPYDF